MNTENLVNNSMLWGHLIDNTGDNASERETNQYLYGQLYKRHGGVIIGSRSTAKNPKTKQTKCKKCKKVKCICKKKPLKNFENKNIFI